MGNFDDILKKKLNSLGISRQVEAAGVVEAARKEIAKFIPEEDFEVVSFNRRILKINTSSAVVANEIILNSDKFFLTKYHIKKIIFN